MWLLFEKREFHKKIYDGSTKWPVAKKKKSKHALTTN
jgi:hypothetical protein